METLTGTVVSMSRPYNAGWRIIELGHPAPHGTKATGVLPDEISPGDYCSFEGTWKEKGQYGKQFEFKQVVREIPKDELGMRRYLDTLPWCGPTTAAALIDEFGEQLFDVIENHPERLVTIRGISEERAQQIQRAFIEMKLDRESDLFFATHGISLGLRMRLVAEYGSKKEAIRTITQNPYMLADDVWGVGFKRADAIALSTGVQKNSQFRIRSGIRWILQDAASGQGHACLPMIELIDRASGILEVRQSEVREIIEHLVRDFSLVCDSRHYVYLAQFHHYEQMTAIKLRNLSGAHHEVIMHELSPEDLLEMDEDQRTALRYALESKLLIITGGPGVGKTYTINQILKAINDGKRKILLAAPTGKAAKRMQEATGLESQTIHRLMKFSPTNGWQVDADDPLDADTVIIDESSMIDIELMHHLLDGIDTKRTQVIFVGDVDQLPSVGPGRVFGDLIDSNTIPTVRLTKLHRQAEHSWINKNAQRINRGDPVELEPETDTPDFFFVHEEDKNQIPDRIVEVCTKFAGYYGYSLEDIQVLAPQKKGPAGTEELNRILQPVLNPIGEKLKGCRFCVGDRVIQLRNNYEVNVYNGDIGTILGFKMYRSSAISFEELCGLTSDLPVEASKEEELLIDETTLVIDFDGREVEYPMKWWEEIQLSYALTIHKSQGSEFKVVVIPVHTTNHIMLKRNLLYTGITRAKENVILIGTKKAVQIATKTVDASTRWTGLKEMLLGTVEPERIGDE